jgi:hypothetical protein
MWRGLAILLMLAVTAPAQADQPSSVVDWWNPPTGLMPPKDSGKPTIFVPPSSRAPGRTEACTPPLPCGAQLLGTVQRNGAVELRVPALRW